MKTSLARFDTRLPEDQKEYFEYAAGLGGYRTLTEFVISSVQQKADEIVEKHRIFLATEKDQKIFFHAVMNPPAPNKRLLAAVKKYNKLNEKK
jgi:uncharacterized protein (DUF1778 family)